MSFLVGEISAAITADDKGFQATITRVKKDGTQAVHTINKSWQELGAQMRRTGAIMTASLTVPIVAGMRAAVKESALLEGAMAKFDVVFGKQARATEQWVNEFREGVPLARREIIQAASAMQDLLVPMGVARDEATDMTKEWLELAAALAAFNDVPVEQALEAIRSGIAGQSRPLRQFGIDVRETALQQRALEMGLISSGEAMNDQTRQQALLAQAYANSKDAVDGYQDQLGSTLMAEQELQASAKDLLATYGQDLKPMYDQMVGSLTGFLKALNDMDESQRRNIIRALKWTAALGPGLAILGQLTITLPKVIKHMRGLAGAMIINPYVALGVALAGLLIHVSDGVRKTKEFREELEKLKGAASTAGSLDALNEAIAEQSERISIAEKNFNRMGASSKAAVEAQRRSLQGMKDDLEELIEKRDKAALMQIDQIISDKAKEEAKEAEAALREVESRVKAIKPAVEAIPPVDEILDFEEPIRQAKELWQIIQEMEADEDFTQKMFNPGSLGFYEQALMNVRERLREATDPAEIQALQDEIQRLQERINDFGGTAVESTRNADMAMGALSNSIGGVVGQLIAGKKEALSFGNILKTVAPALINVLTGGTGGFAANLASGIFGGMFHGGGIVGGSGERMIKVKGGEGVFTQGQMKAMGSIQPASSGLNPMQLEKAFSRALSAHLEKLSPEGIYALSRKGQHSF